MQQNLTKTEAAKQQYKTARYNLLLMLVLTAVNIALLFFGSDRMLLFSATVPYISVIYGSVFSWVFENEIYFMLGIAVAAVLIALYLICFIFSKKRVGFMVAALVMFVLDIAAMVWMYISSGDFADGIIDIVFHAWVLIYLASGVYSGFKLKKLPEEEPVTETVEGSEEVANSTALRYADNDVKFRVLAQAEQGSYQICYRRVKRTNELVVNGHVYGEYEALLEQPHELSAVIDGHTITAGTNSASRSYITFDGEVIAKKFRLV